MPGRIVSQRDIAPDHFRTCGKYNHSPTILWSKHANPLVIDHEGEGIETSEPWWSIVGLAGFPPLLHTSEGSTELGAKRVAANHLLDLVFRLTFRSGQVGCIVFAK